MSWIVRNAVQTPECGNGIWARSRTRLGAHIAAERIRHHRQGSGFYEIPAGGLVVVRASKAFQPAAGTNAVTLAWWIS